MQYPMPENMGYPLPRTLMDMLPDELEIAQMEAIRRYAAKEKCGLHEYVCPICGTRFEASTEYRYRLKVGKRQRVYCSHKCFRVDEAKEQERYKREMLGRWANGSQGMTEVKRTQLELRRTQKKLAEWQEKKNDPGFADLPKGKQREIENGIAKWLAREVLDMEALEVAKAKCNTKNF